MSRIDSAYETFINELPEKLKVTEEQKNDKMFQAGVKIAIISYACPHSFGKGPYLGWPGCSTHCVQCWKEKEVLINESV